MPPRTSDRIQGNDYPNVCGANMIYPTGVRKGMGDNGTAVYIKSVRIALGIAYDMEWLLL